MARRDLTPRTKALYGSLLDWLILPEFGDEAVASITPKQVRAWFDRMGRERAAQGSHAYALLKQRSSSNQRRSNNARRPRSLSLVTGTTWQKDRDIALMPMRGR
ncbi:hypothetical protein GCM10009638_04720 [Luteococcus sanguinis]